MGEMSKQVRVDNWGTFFLQRLQSFFNKTEYCDLTLQFEGNVQLKVHRLVLYACTEYFHVLEHTCTMTDDILIMPPDLQADVIVPIINFMYTGMLEFQLSMFDKLYQAATLMNITILTKLLDAQRKPYFHKPHAKKAATEKKSPVHKPAGNAHLPPTLPGRKLPVWKRKIAPSHTPEPSVSPLILKPRVQPPSDPLAIYDNTPKPTRFEWPEEDLSAFNPLDSTFDDISYTSRPLLTQEDELKACSEAKRAAFFGKQGKTTDGDDYVREQKVRFAFDDDESMDTADVISVDSSAIKRKMDNVSPTSSTSSASKRVRFNLGEKENKEKKFSITTSGKASDMDHTKIISELLKKYPELVKKNKNIRLKIMTKGSSAEKNTNTKPVSKVRVQVSPKQSVQKVVKVVQDPKKDDGPWTCHLCSSTDEKVEFVLYYLYRKHMTDVHNEKFDSRMCKFCGHKSQKHNMLMYHMYTKHGVKPPAAYNFPKCNQCNYIALTEALLFKHKLNHTRYELQCRECKIAFTSTQALENHMQVSGHSTQVGKTNFNCQYCGKQYQSGANLFSHIKVQHRQEAKRDGIVNIDEIEDNADGDDDDTIDTKQQIREEDEYITPEIINETKSKEKFKILQNVKVPVVSQQEQEQAPPMALEPSSEAEALSNVASGIATSLGLVDIVVLNDNQQYILQSNEQLSNSQPEFILPELNTTQFTQNQTITNQGEMNANHNVLTQSMLNTGDIASTDELVMVLTDHDYGDGNNELITNDNSNIVVLYSHPVDGQENQFITSQSNLMVNSQTGMIEIRNSGINTTTPNTIVVTQAQDTPIESIEMIQQEINSQLQQDDQNTQQVQVAENQLASEQEQQQQQQQFVEAESGGEVPEEEEQQQLQQQQQEQQDVGEQSVVQPEAEDKNEEAVLQEQETAEKMEETQEEEQQQPPPPPPVEEMGTTEEQQTEMPNLEDEAQNEPQETQNPTPTEPQEEENTAPQLTAEPETAQAQNAPNKDLEMPVLEEEEPAPAEDNNPSVFQDESEKQQEQQQHEVEEEEFPDQSNEASEVPSEDHEENSQSSHSSVRQQQDGGGFDGGEAVAVAPPTTKISILDDWEDTDSQQSEQSRGPKTGNTVNKLIDDWADEEEDENKRTAN